jgi:hypothetical protein
VCSTATTSYATSFVKGSAARPDELVPVVSHRPECSTSSTLI